jgi:hypothetical protein
VLELVFLAARLAEEHSRRFAAGVRWSGAGIKRNGGRRRAVLLVRNQATQPGAGPGRMT